MSNIKCANFKNCGHVVDNPRLKGEFCSLQCRAHVLRASASTPRATAVEARVTKPVTTNMVTKTDKE